MTETDQDTYYCQDVPEAHLQFTFYWSKGPIECPVPLILAFILPDDRVIARAIWTDARTPQEFVTKSLRCTMENTEDKNAFFTVHRKGINSPFLFLSIEHLLSSTIVNPIPSNPFPTILIYRGESKWETLDA